MGSFLSKEKSDQQPIEPKVVIKEETSTTVKLEEVDVKVGSKRGVPDYLDETVKTKKSKRKDGWAKKAAEGKPKGGELTPRPESLGPREARVAKTKVALLIGFNGTGFQGMQINQNAKSIEGTLFDALVKAGAISKDNSDDLKKVNWMRAARTDKGVHAAGNVVSLKMQVEDENIVEKVNSFLPPQIRVWGYIPAIRSFHAKNLCDSRIYEYLLPTCAFMEPAKKVLTDTPTFENDIAICDNRVEENIVKYTTRSTPEEIQKRHDYRATPEQIQTFRDAMSCYVGTHNFHNYTNGKPFKDRSANRYILSIDVSDPLYIDGSEWLSIKLHGQSFILHQIRKMISMAMLITRSGTPVSLIPQTFESNKINIPKAPALGLLLERPVFTVYNEKLREKSKDVVRDPINFDKYADQIEEFKREWIYKKIFDAENQEHVFDGYLTSLDAHIGPDYLYLNKQGVIPPECLISTKYNKESDDEETGEQ